MLRGVRLLSCVVLAGLSSACGSVVIERQTTGAGGDSAGTGTPAATGGNATSTGAHPTSASTSASTGGDPALGDLFCSVAANCLNGCHHVSDVYQSDPCGAEGKAYITCLASHLDPATCLATGCDAEQNAFTQCRSSVPQGCIGGGGGGSNDTCSETDQCVLGDERVLCDGQNGVADCSCYLNYLLVGTCSAPFDAMGGYGLGPSCSVHYGCCAQFFGT